MGDDTDGSTNGYGFAEALYTVSVAITGESPVEELPLEFDYAVGHETIAEDHPFELEFELRSEGGSRSRSPRAPWPFRVVWMGREGAPDTAGITLWTDAYEGSSHVGTEGRRATEV